MSEYSYICIFVYFYICVFLYSCIFINIIKKMITDYKYCVTNSVFLISSRIP